MVVGVVVGVVFVVVCGNKQCYHGHGCALESDRHGTQCSSFSTNSIKYSSAIC